MKYIVKPFLVSLLLGAISSLHAGSDTALLLNVDFAKATENTRGALTISSGLSEDANTRMTVIAKTVGGTTYAGEDIGTESGGAFLKLEPEKKSFLEAALPESGALGNDDFSIAFWHRPSLKEMAPGYLASTGTSEPTWIVRFDEDNRITISFNGHAKGSGGSTLRSKSNEALKPDEWNHVTIVFDRNDSILVYINGELDSTSASISSHIESMPARIFLGGPHQYPSGDLGQFQIYRGKLDLAQVQNLAREQSATE